MGAFVSVPAGFIFCVVAVPLLFWNEGRAVRTHRGLVEGVSSVTTIRPESVDASREGKLVHVTGNATSSETLQDSEFGVATKAIKLRRRAEIYQWKESRDTDTRNNTGGRSESRTAYTYQKVWSDKPIESGSFKQSGHTNTGQAVPDSQIIAQTVNLGAFRLSQGLLEQWNTYVPLRDRPLLKGPSGAQLHLADGAYYFGDPAHPRIGDNRITFEIVQPATVSLVAMQQGNTFAPYQTAAGTSLEMLKVGNYSSGAMFQSAMQQNTVLTWLLRGGGYLLLFFGIMMIFRPLAAAADVVPFFGRHLSHLLDAGIGIFAFFMAGALTIVVIAIGWIAYRPVLGISLLTVAALLVLAVRSVADKRRRLSATA